MTEVEALRVLRGGAPEAAARAEALLWEMWHRSGDGEADALLREGVAALGRGDLTSAEKIFARVIERAPRFAEGWNKRATVRYLARNYDGSIADCEATLERKPSHFGALSGQGLCYMALGRHREAAAMFRRALAVHPRLEGARHNLAAALGEAVRGNGH
jgi:tetratricopeptide (TPR) repeat protein